MLRRVRAYLSKTIFKLNIKLHEKKYKTKKAEVKYLLYRKKKSKDLIIIFSGMSSQRAVYNYVTTLKNESVNRLYILDDAGADKLGCYYIGTNNNNEIEIAVTELIEYIVGKYQLNNLKCVGSSKGGYAAINFGLAFNADIIVGAPQFYLGYYLTHPYIKPMLTTILGENYLKEDFEVLETRLYNCIVKYKDQYTKTIYLHYSIKEHTYQEHIADLIENLKKMEYKMVLDELKYNKHDEVAIYFPIFLKKILNL